jgi:hypothetical protein
MLSYGSNHTSTCQAATEGATSCLPQGAPSFPPERVVCCLTARLTSCLPERVAFCLRNTCGISTVRGFLSVLKRCLLCSRLASCLTAVAISCLPLLLQEQSPVYLCSCRSNLLSTFAPARAISCLPRATCGCERQSTYCKKYVAVCLLSNTESILLVLFCLSVTAYSRVLL